MTENERENGLWLCISEYDRDKHDNLQLVYVDGWYPGTTIGVRYGGDWYGFDRMQLMNMTSNPESLDSSYLVKEYSVGYRKIYPTHFFDRTQIGRPSRTESTTVIEALEKAMMNCSYGLSYIRMRYGDLPGVGFDRARDAQLKASMMLSEWREPANEIKQGDPGTNYPNDFDGAHQVGPAVGNDVDS